MSASATSDICPVCRGSGNILTFARGLRWWTCVCGGSGTTVQHGPATIVMRGRPAKRRKGPSR